MVLATVAGWFLLMESPQAEVPRELARVSVRELSAFRPETTYEDYSGVLRPRRTAEISTKIAERVERLHVDVGDRVEVGMPLAQLKQAELSNNLQLAKGELDAATARLAELIEGPRRQEIERAVASVRERQAALDLRKSTFQRMVSAIQNDSVAKLEVDTSNFMLQAAEAQLSQAEQTLDELRVGVRPEQVDAQRAAVEVGRAKLKQLELQLEEATIRAPFQGTIQAVYVTEGELLKPGQPLLSLLETDHIEVHAGLPPSMVQALKRATDGTRIHIRLDGYQHSAELLRISPAIDDVTGMQKAIFVLTDSTATPLVPGLAVTVRIQAAVDPTAMWIPRSALVSSSQGQWGCYLVRLTETPDVYRVDLCPIEISREHADLVRIQGELDDRSLVIVHGTHRVFPGQLVRLRDDQVLGG